MCIVTQITNLKYNRDQKTVFVTACFSIASSLRASSSFGGDRKTSHALGRQRDTRGALARSRVLSWITLARHLTWGNFSQAKLLHGQVLQYIHEISVIEEGLHWKCLQMKVTNKTMSTCSKRETIGDIIRGLSCKGDSSIRGRRVRNLRRTSDGREREVHARVLIPCGHRTPPFLPRFLVHRFCRLRRF